MVSIDGAQLSAWVAGLLLPLVRILGLLAIAPVFAHTVTPARVKIGLGVLLAVIVAPTLPSITAFDPLSLGGLMLIGQQLVIGLAMGFAMRIVFAAVEFAGEVAGMTMGLGFAAFFDPTTQGQSIPLNTFLTLLMALVFLAINGHLLLLATLVRSFHDLPIGGASPAPEAFWRIAQWGGYVFSAGAQLSLPIVAALLITNIALGILTRAAPQLNLFGIGFPLTLTVGIVMVALVLPTMATPMVRLLEQGIGLAGQAMTGR